MSDVTTLKSSKRSGKCALIGGAFLVFFGSTTSRASEFTAGVVMEKMEAAERYTFVAGIVEGLAIARYFKDRQQPTGMNCIYDWFYRTPETKDAIYAGFKRYPTYPPGTVVHVLAKQKCGE